jgi:hypothetical protein
MKTAYWFPSVLLLFSLTNAQFYPYINTIGDIGIGYKTTKVSPYFGLSLSSYFNRVGDTLISSDIIISPNIGINLAIVKNPIDVLWDFRIGTTLYTSNEYHDLVINPRIGVGVEKSFEHCAIAGEICANYSLDKYKISSNVTCYNHQFSFVPEIVLKYYLSKNKFK